MTEDRNSDRIAGLLERVAEVRELKKRQLAASEQTETGEFMEDSGPTDYDAPADPMPADTAETQHFEPYGEEADQERSEARRNADTMRQGGGSASGQRPPTDHLAVGHLTHIGDVLVEIRDNTRASAEADVAFIALVEAGGRWARNAFLVCCAALGVLGLASLAITFLAVVLPLFR